MSGHLAWRSFLSSGLDTRIAMVKIGPEDHSAIETPIVLQGTIVPTYLLLLQGFSGMIFVSVHQSGGG